MPAEIRIRAAAQVDAPSIAFLAGQLGYPLSAAQARTRLALLGADHEQGVYVAVRDPDEIVGWIHVLGARRLLAEPFAEIGGLVVTEAQRGKGIGVALLQRATRWARESGYSSMRICSNVIRERAHGFYARLGYERVKSQHVYTRSLAPAEDPDGVTS